MFMRDPVMGRFVRHSADDAGLRVRPTHNVDTRQFAKSGLTPVCGDGERGIDSPAIRQFERGRSCFKPCIGKRGVFENNHIRRRHCLGERPANMGVFDNPAQRAFAHFPMIVVQEKLRGAIGNTNFENGLRVCL